MSILETADDALTQRCRPPGESRRHDPAGHSVDFNGPDEITSNWGATKDGDAVSGSVYKVRRLRNP